MAMVAIDIIWPFFGSGPMYTQISLHLQGKCLANWWMNLLALGNVKSAPENVSNNNNNNNNREMQFIRITEQLLAHPHQCPIESGDSIEPVTGQIASISCCN